MATKVHMEALSPTMAEGQVVKWLKSEGEEVAGGEVIAEIETDKATMELVARGEGVLRKIFLKEGGSAPVGEVIAVIAAEDEDISGMEVAPEEEAGAESAPFPASAGPKAREMPDAEASVGADPGRVKASPLARRLAERAGIDLSAVEGSGPGGRIVRRDIESWAPAAGAMEAAPRPLGDTGEEYEDIPLTQMRKTIARRLVRSIGPVPHFFLTIDVDMGRLLEARRRINALLEKEGERVSITDLIIRATAAALKRHPECNSAWNGDSIRRHARVHVGVAVAVEEGLITPVIRDADRKGVASIGREVRELAARAREKRLAPEEYTGSTFSISNLGTFGIHEFTAVINPPEAGILAIGGVEETPVAVGGEVVVRPRMRITMSCDHRVIDGASGARFLATLKRMLEEPGAILV